ncbi:MAG: hypothetical protein ACI9FB_002908 [Candidatus Azotimanducaceae bacterium]|jgi:hypothetical protein
MKKPITQFSTTLCLILLLNGCATSKFPNVSSKDSQTSEIVSNERLIARAPSDWQLIFELNNSGTRLSDYIPKDENKDDWQTKLSFEAHEQLASVDPISIMMGEISKMDEICTNVDHANLFSGFENGYPTSVRLLLCGENAHSGKGEVSITKGIQGKESFYIVRLEKKIEPFEKGKADFPQNEIAEWSTYLKRITLCDETSDATHACPSASSLPE